MHILDNFTRTCVHVSVGFKFFATAVNNFYHVQGPFPRKNFHTGRAATGKPSLLDYGRLGELVYSSMDNKATENACV